MLSPERDSVCNNLVKDEETCLDVGKSNMSSFCSLTEEQKQVSHVMEVCVVVAIKLSARGDIPLSSSRTTCSISGTSCCELKSKTVPRLKEMLLFKALKKLEGSIGEEERFIKDMFSDMDLTNGER